MDLRLTGFPNQLHLFSYGFIPPFCSPQSANTNLFHKNTDVPNTDGASCILPSSVVRIAHLNLLGLNFQKRETILDVLRTETLLLWATHPADKALWMPQSVEGGDVILHDGLSTALTARGKKGQKALLAVLLPVTVVESWNSRKQALKHEIKTHSHCFYRDASYGQKYQNTVTTRHWPYINNSNVS